MIAFLMPSRKHAFTNHSFYHIYDKTLDQKRIFLDECVSQYFLKAVHFYSYKIPSGISFSRYRRMKLQDRSTFSSQYFKKKNQQVTVNVFTLMPNHYHLLLQQKSDNGIVNMMTKTMDSITRYYNIKKRRKGPLFLPHFNAVPILSKQQLVYVSKYIHLNPLAAGLVNSPSELLRFRFSTVQEYVLQSKNLSWIDTKRILMHFDYSKEAYWLYLIGKSE